jgi:FixJ family two-component response regulator
MFSAMQIDIIEENVSVSRMLTELLEQHGYRVSVYEHAAHYLSAAGKEGHVHPQVVLADLHHSRQWFPEATEMLCQAMRETPLLLMSSLPDIQERFENVIALPKPFLPMKVEAVLNDLKARHVVEKQRCRRRNWLPRLTFGLLPSLA